MKIAFDLRGIKNPDIGRYMKGLTEDAACSAAAYCHASGGCGEAVCA